MQNDSLLRNKKLNFCYKVFKKIIIDVARKFKKYL